MIEFDIDNTQKTPYLLLLESLVNQSNALKTIHNHKTWCLSALTYALHLNDCLVLFEDLKNRWARELPFEEAWDVDFRKWKTDIWSAANDIQQSEESREWKSLCDCDYNRFIELSQQVTEGAITIIPLVEFVENKETSIQKIITDAGRKLSGMLTEIDSATNHTEQSLYLSFYNECIETYIQNNRDNLHLVKVNDEWRPYETWEASKTARNRPAAIKTLINGIVKEIKSYKTLAEVWCECYDEKTKEIDGEAIARNLFINRKDFISRYPLTCRDKMDKLFYTVTMLEFLNERLKELTSSSKRSLTAEQQEEMRKQSNHVFRPQVNGKDINFSKLVAFIYEYGVNTITYKYEWIAIYLFAQKHDLLVESQLTSFAEQMKRPEWFGHVTERRQCTADAMGDYNFLTIANKSRWMDDSLFPDGTKATKSGRNRIIKRFDNLDSSYDVRNIC